MKHITFLYNDAKNYSKAQKVAQKSKYTSQLIQVFCGVLQKKQIKQILHRLKNDFPNAIIIGTTTAGEISHAKTYDNSIVVSLSLFEKTQLKWVYEKQITQDSGKKIAKKIFDKQTKAAVVLSEGLQGKDYVGFIDGLRTKHEDVIIAGGLSGDNFHLEKTYIFAQDTLFDEGVVAVAFSSKELQASNEYNLNWEPIGKQFTITKAHGNVVEEIDGVKAVDFFKRYLGEEIFYNYARALPDFQLLHKEGNATIARTPLVTDGSKIIFAAPMQEGEQFQFGFAHATSIVRASNKIAQKIAQKSVESIYIYSCIARKTLLGRTLEAEFESFEHVAPTAGFFTYGEFYSTQNNNALLNCTTTILTLSEGSKKSKKKQKQAKLAYVADLKDSTFGALSHFIQQTSKELEASAKLMQQYQNIVDASSIVSKTDPKGRITYANDNFSKISGYSKEELLGKSHNIVRDEHMDSEVFRDLWKTIKGGDIWQGRISNKAKDGSIYYVDATIMPIFNDKGKIEEYIAVRYDVTEQVATLEYMESKERLLQAMFDNQDNIVLLTTKDFGMIKVNQKFFEYFDFKNFEDFKKRFICICDLFICDNGYVNTQSMPNWIDEISSNPQKDYKVKMKVHNGAIHTFSIRIKKIDNEYLINLNDITSLEQALVKAYASEQAKSMFLASMSHEIRTPLNGILGFTDVLSKRSLDSESLKYVNIIQKSGDVLMQIVNDILDFSKIESGSLSLNETPTNLYEAVETSVSTFASLAKNKHLNYYAYIDTRIPKLLLCDAQRIKQVLNNLISNAIKFTPENGEVAINVLLKKLTKKKAVVTFSVLDSGIGIPKKGLEKIFQPFSQADNLMGKEFKGTGLGLSISNQFVNMMGSSIEVKSKKNKGSEFYFELELDVIDKAAVIAKPQESADDTVALIEPLKKDVQNQINNEVATYEGKIVVAEDNETNQLLISVLLDARGIEHKVVADGVELLKEIEENDVYDLILMDINMPRLDGVEATKQLRAKGYEKPIVSISANVIEADTESFKKAGMDATLNKPIDPVQLDAVLHRYLEVVQKERVSFDTPDPDALAKSLFLDEATVLRLFGSLKESFSEALELIEVGKLDRALAHKVKGAAGNMKLQNLYEYAKEVEFAIEAASVDQVNEFASILKQHLKHAIEAIDQLG